MYLGIIEEPESEILFSYENLPVVKEKSEEERLFEEIENFVNDRIAVCSIMCEFVINYL